jgi:hypothetical protein
MGEVEKVYEHMCNLVSNGEVISPGDEDGEPDADFARAGSVKPPRPRSFGFNVDRLNTEYALVLMGSKAVILRERSNGPIEDRVRILGLDAFRAWYSNRFTETVGKDGRIGTTTFAEAWLRNRDRRQFEGLEFHPDPGGAPGTPGYFNLWRGYAVEPKSRPGAYSVFDDHLRNNLCHGSPALYAWVFGWFAHMVQRPRERTGTALVCRGKMGTGKTKIGEVIGTLFPAHYFLVDDPRYLVGQFNAHMASCLLLQADEGFWAGDKAAEGRLKGLVTAEFQMIEAKGIDPIRLKNFVRLLITSNEDWVIPAGKDERRFCVLDIDPRCAQNHEYFREMDAELDNGGREALLADLLAFDLSAVNLRQIPHTKALLEQKLRSLDSIESWWLERLMAGTTTRAGETWEGEIPRAALFDDYIAAAEKIGIRRKAEETAFGIKLEKLVPELGTSRRHVEVSPGLAKRARCYVLPSLAECREAFEQELNQPIEWDHYEA